MKLLLLLLFPMCLAANYGNVTCKLLKVYDADTIICDIPEWETVPIISKNIKVRLLLLDTPESRPKRKGRSRESIKEEKRAAKLALIFSKKLFSSAEKIELRNVRKGKYFRLLSDIWLLMKNKKWINYSTVLVNSGHGYRYDGGKKRKFDEWYKK